jgi:hypothetical protein
MWGNLRLLPHLTQLGGRPDICMYVCAYVAVSS